MRKMAVKQIPFSALHFTRNLQEKNHSIYNHEISWIIKTWKEDSDDLLRGR